MPRTFYVTAGGLTLANQPVTLAFINPPAAPNVAIEILRCWVSQSGSVVSAMQRVSLVTQVAAFPTLTAATPRNANLADATASVIVGGTAGAAGTAGVNASAEGAGAKIARVEDSFNVNNGWTWVFTSDERIILPAGVVSGFGLFLPVAAATLTNWQCGIVYREN